MTTSQLDEAMHTYRTLIHTARRLRRSVNAILKDYSLTGAQFALLNAIPADGIPLTQLASLSWADPGNVSGTVDRLESAGWVIKERSEDDRRVVLVSLSERGRQMLESLRPQHQAGVAEALQALSSDDMAQLRELLALIEQGIGGREDSI